jgi:nucleoside-diphosphate-sugar epimerase
MLTSNQSIVLVTGAGGFLGSEIVRQIAQTGMRIRATDKIEILRFSGIDYCRADILNPESLKPIMKNVEVVIHAAGLAHVFDKSNASSVSFKAVNEIGTENILRAAMMKGVQHIILISSVAVYGSCGARGDEDSSCQPEGPYAESKWQAEQRAIEITRNTENALTILRMATIYGEGDPGNVGRLMKAIDRRRFVWVGNGSNRKSLIHREDAARSCVTVLQTPIRGIHIYNVSAPPCTMRDIVENLALALGRPIPRWHIPGSLALRLAWMGKGLSRGQGRFWNFYTTLKKWLEDDIYDTSKFEKKFNFKTQVSLVQGLKREVAWYRSQTL